MNPVHQSPSALLTLCQSYIIFLTNHNIKNVSSANQKLVLQTHEDSGRTVPLAPDHCWEVDAGLYRLIGRPTVPNLIIES